MKRKRLFLALGLAAAAIVVLVPAALSQPASRGGAEALIVGRDGQTLGRVVMEPRRGGAVEVRVRVRELPPGGFRSFHVHEVGTCDRSFRTPDGTPAPFESAGGHYNPTGVPHGLHAADFPPLLVSAGGTAEAAFVTDRFRIGQLLDMNGSAAIVHEGRDNQANIPARYRSDTTGETGPDAPTQATGDAGGRVACGVVRRTGG